MYNFKTIYVEIAHRCRGSSQVTSAVTEVNWLAFKNHRILHGCWFIVRALAYHLRYACLHIFAHERLKLRAI
jgi:hypothetical protein